MDTICAYRLVGEKRPRNNQINLCHSLSRFLPSLKTISVHIIGPLQGTSAWRDGEIAREQRRLEATLKSTNPVAEIRMHRLSYIDLELHENQFVGTKPLYSVINNPNALQVQLSSRLIIVIRRTIGTWIEVFALKKT